MISRPEAPTQEADAATDEVIKPSAVPQTGPLLPSIPRLTRATPAGSFGCDNRGRGSSRLGSVPQLAPKATGSPHSGIREMQALAARYHRRPQPRCRRPELRDARARHRRSGHAAREGFTKYTPSGGLASLRELILEKVRARNGLDCSLEQIDRHDRRLRRALHDPADCSLDPGDEVLLPDPGWANYPPMVHVLGGAPSSFRSILRSDSTPTWRGSAAS